MAVCDIALIGYGYWGKKLYQYLKQDQRFCLRYVHFPSLKGLELQAIQKTYGKEFIPDVDTLWQDSSVRNVIIATPIHTHYSVALDALVHKKNILVVTSVIILIAYSTAIAAAGAIRCQREGRILAAESHGATPCRTRQPTRAPFARAQSHWHP